MVVCGLVNPIANGHKRGVVSQILFLTLATREAHEYWHGWPLPSPGYLPDLEIGLGSPALQVDFFFTN